MPSSYLMETSQVFNYCQFQYFTNKLKSMKISIEVSPGISLWISSETSLIEMPVTVTSSIILKILTERLSL